MLCTVLLCLNYGSLYVNPLDLSPRFAGILFGISNLFGSLAGCVAPLVTGYFTNGNPTRGQYRKVFLLAAGVSAFGGSFYSIFLSGQQQKWNDGAKKPDLEHPVTTVPTVPTVQDD